MRKEKQDVSTSTVTRRWQPAFEQDKVVFEVSASTYPWEVHDEEVERVRDNM
ncbi:MAG: hypothetical protein ACYTEO_12845 [Planctomycetota bacterium]|jgi:hypothetical protein